MTWVSSCQGQAPLDAAPLDAALPGKRLGVQEAVASKGPARALRPVVRRLPLVGPLAESSAEVSGLAWHEGDLVLLPQHPFRLSGYAEHGRLYTLSKERIQAFLSGQDPRPLRPQPLTLLAPGLEVRSPTYQGCEAIAFHDGRAYLTTEVVADVDTGAMRGSLFAGSLRGDTLRLDTNSRAELPPQTDVDNMAYEALVSGPRRVMALYEANGRNVNAHPRAIAFTPSLQPLEALAFPPLEYRLTDTTALDAEGRFWVANYFFPGERKELDPAPVPGLPASGSSPGAAHTDPVERLVEFRYRDEGGGRLQRTEAAPLYLPASLDAPHNWEGLARLHSRMHGPGFLVITDQYPETVLGFVSWE